ncbi:MAG: ribonuclease J [Bacilli bacterium]|jgi:ribonuclease J|nr:ribonuclease J [Acholeplasmataceae bacterium]
MNSSKKQNKKGKDPNNEVKVFALGGLGAVGMNMYVVEVANQIIVIDAGILFAGGEAPGVDYIIPDVSYLKENEQRIVGLFITHGHEDHIGGIPFLVQKVKIPAIYASGLAVGLIRNKMREYPQLSYNIIPYNDDSVYKYPHFSISFFRTNHSIPDSFGIAIKTNLGYVIYTGDFKFDFTPIGKKADYYKMARYGEEGVLCLLSDSTNANITNFSLSEKKIAQNMQNLFSQIKGRIIVATFASNVFRVQQILNASYKTGRKVVVFGHSMEKTIDVATKLKYINIPKGTIINTRELSNVEDQKITLLCTGSQGEPMAALSRIANGTHKHIKLQAGDTVIYSSKAIPGNEQFINRNINKMVQAGANVIKNSPLTDTHTTGHASEAEIQLMLSLIKPKYFLPVHGEYNMLQKHANIAVNMGLKKENTFVLDNGDVVTFTEKGAKLAKAAVFTTDIYLDSSLSDVDSNILKERKHLADEGIITIAFTVNKEKQILAPTTLKTKGFVDVEKSADLVKKIIKKADEIFKGLLARYKYIIVKNFRHQILQQLSQYIYEETERRPFIVPIIMIV